MSDFGACNSAVVRTVQVEYICMHSTLRDTQGLHLSGFHCLLTTLCITPQMLMGCSALVYVRVKAEQVVLACCSKMYPCHAPLWWCVYGCKTSHPQQITHFLHLVVEDVLGRILGLPSFPMRIIHSIPISLKDISCFRMPFSKRLCR